MSEWKAEIVRDLGGMDNLSAQQLGVLEVLTRTKVMLDGVDNFILSQRSLINKRKKSLLPIVRERAVLAESFVKHLQILGLERRTRPVQALDTYIEGKRKESATSPTEPGSLTTIHETHQPNTKE